MILGIDIDDTITDSSKTIDIYLKKEYPDYDNYHMLPKKEYKRFLKKYIKEMRDAYPIKEGVLEAWDYFKKNHFKIILITARDNKNYRGNIKDTKKFLARHGIFYDKIYFKQKKKGKKARKEHVDLFIDDKENNLDSVSRYGISCVCFGKSSKYPSFLDWYSLLDYIKEVEQHE